MSQPAPKTQDLPTWFMVLTTLGGAVSFGLNLLLFYRLSGEHCQDYPYAWYASEGFENYPNLCALPFVDSAALPSLFASFTLLWGVAALLPPTVRGMSRRSLTILAAAALICWVAYLGFMFV